MVRECSAAAVVTVKRPREGTVLESEPKAPKKASAAVTPSTPPPPQAPKEQKIRKDMFGRPLAPPKALTSASRGAGGALALSSGGHKVRYKLVVATTSSVKRPAKIEEFL